ncbi:MAG: discoidin domain-containing protein, partial [Cytophagaceae bacterium]|nr:discoidin domain-containing protein [Cytophagaceae bacterium]
MRPNKMNPGKFGARGGWSIVFSVSLLFLLLGAQAQNRITMPNGQQIFMSGMNIAWQDFANDVGDTPINAQQWATILDNVKNAGGNTIRWWLYTNASRAPKFTNGLVSGLGTQSVNNIRTVLDLAQERNMVVILCLFSFDLLQNGQYMINVNNNYRMLTTDEGMMACIDNCIVPTVTQIGLHPAIACWEIFNEPEGMLQNGGWTSVRLSSRYYYQRFINRAAGAIHRAVPGVLVSSGAKHFQSMSNVSGWWNYYSDQELRNAGQDNDGYLDFYMDHYYDNEGAPGTQHSPFHHNPAYWGLDKPIVVAEFAARGYNGNFQMSGEECFRQVYNRGYAGALSWTYTNHDGFGGLAESTPGLTWVKNNSGNALVYDAQPEPNFGTNIALNKPVTVSSTEANSVNVANLVNDGNRTTRWASAYANNQTLVIDLGAFYSIQNMIIRWEAAYGSAYTVQFSNDNQTWTTARTITNGDGGRDILQNLTGTGRYIRLQLTTRATQWGFSIYEVEAYGTLLTCSAAITASGSTTICQGQSLTLSASTGSSYAWFLGTTALGTTQSITVTTAGSYTVRVTASNGCSATSAATAVTVNTLPAANITAATATTFCSGGSVV